MKKYWIPAAVFYVLILIGSSIPGKHLQKIAEFTPDKLFHTLEYFVFGYLIFRWLYNDYHDEKKPKLIVITLILGALAGLTDELYQQLTPGRFTDAWDWALDFTGVALSIPFFLWTRKLFSF